MAKITTEFHPDDRWGGHMDIGKKGAVTVSIPSPPSSYGIELWIRLKSYPIIRRESGTQIVAPCKLLELRNGDKDTGDRTVVTYDEYRLRFENIRTRQVVFVAYTPGNWFQLALSNGLIGTIGLGAGQIYIDGTKKDSTMVFPSSLFALVIGNDLRRGDEVRFNPKYPTESSLGLIRVYDRVLSKDEVYNNYLSDARRYGLALQREGSVIKHGILLELIALPNAVATRQEYWYSTGEIHAASMEESKKQNTDTDYMTSRSDLVEINAALKALSQQSSSQVKRTQGQKNMDGNIIILSRNPEMFSQHMQHKDAGTTNLIIQSQGSPSREDYASIFDNPLKIKLLVNYLQSKPSHFLALLRSDILTNEQLVILNSALQGQSQGMASGVATVLEGFSDMEPMDSSHLDRYSLAVGLLQQKLGSRRPIAAAAAVGGPLDRMADLMQYNHDRQRLAEKRNEYEDYMSTIQNLNEKVTNVNVRQRKLEKLLEKQVGLIGLMTSRKSGKCVGAIQRDGHIQHCSHRDAQSPYDIMIRPQGDLNLGDIMQQRGLHGATARQVLKRSRRDGFVVLGQCVNVAGKCVAVIIRRGGANHYIPTATSDPLAEVPILAILSEVSPGDTRVRPAAAPTQPVQEAKAAKCQSEGKCQQGYRPAPVPGVGSESWLGSMESYPEAPWSKKQHMGQEQEEALSAKYAPALTEQEEQLTKPGVLGRLAARLQ